MERTALEKEIGRMREDVEELAGKLGIGTDEALRLMSQRELVILNMELKAIHEMLDLLYGKKLKKKGG